MDVERALITKLIQTGGLETVISRGIREDLFGDPECQKMFRYIQGYKLKYGQPPPKTAAEKDNPKWEWEFEAEGLEALVDRFILLAKRRFANEMVLELAAACDDPERNVRIEEEFLEVSRRLTQLIPATESESFSKNMGRRIESYEQRKREGRIRGIPTGFTALDNATGGIKPHQFWVMSGFTGTGKSTFLKAVAFHAWLQKETPLYFSLEEDAEEIYERLDAMAAGIDYTMLRNLNLPDAQLARWRSYADEVQESVHDIPVIEGGRHVTPDLIYAEAIRWRPSLIVIDYISLMKSSAPTTRGMSMWQSITEITRDLKLTARTLKIPILAAAQTNRSGGKDGAELDNAGYSISISQDPDVALGLFSDEEMRERKEMEIRINKNRRGPLAKTTCIWDHENAIYREKTMVDRYSRAGEKHTDGEPESTTTPKLRPRPGNLK